MHANKFAAQKSSGFVGGLNAEGDLAGAAEVAERVKEEALRVQAEGLRKAKEAYTALQNDPRVQLAAEKTKEKAKQWGQKGFGLLTSALSKARSVAEELKSQSIQSAVPPVAPSGWTEVAPVRAPGQLERVLNAAPKFSIEEDADDAEVGEAARSPVHASTEIRSTGGASASTSDDIQEFQQDSPINVGHWMQKKHTHFFPCKRLGQNGQCTPRYLVVTATHIMDLEAHRTKLNVAKLKAWNSMLDLDKASCVLCHRP
jgi:hypothetical protein